MSSRLLFRHARAWVQWKTDQSNEDWGWKFTASADVGKPSSGGDGEGYWVLGLDKQLAAVGAALAGCLVISLPWGGESEDDNAPWMEDDLLAGAREVSPPAAAGTAGDPSSSLSSSTPALVRTAGVVQAKGNSSASTSAVSSIPGTSSSSGPVAVPEKDEQHQQDVQQRSDGVGGLGRDDSSEGICSRHLELLHEVVDRLEATGGTK